MIKKTVVRLPTTLSKNIWWNSLLTGADILKHSCSDKFGLRAYKPVRKAYKLSKNFGLHLPWKLREIPLQSLTSTGSLKCGGRYYWWIAVLTELQFVRYLPFCVPLSMQYNDFWHVHTWSHSFLYIFSAAKLAKILNVLASTTTRSLLKTSQSDIIVNESKFEKIGNFCNNSNEKNQSKLKKQLPPDVNSVPDYSNWGVSFDFATSTSFWISYAHTNYSQLKVNSDGPSVGR